MVHPTHLTLQRLYEEARVIGLTDRDRWVIFSDLHVGNRTRRDDFLRNGPMFIRVLGEHYLPGGYSLLLNGDVEELHRFWLVDILKAWGDLYGLLRQFVGRQRLVKTIGNHDVLLELEMDYPLRDTLSEAVRLQYGEDTLFLFHGHQASRLHGRVNQASGFLLRYVAKPLGLHPRSVSLDNERRFRVERRVYDFSQSQRIASIIGHTHRPLFESLSKQDALQIRIEQLCRVYPSSPGEERERLSVEIREAREELDRLYMKDGREPAWHSLYNSRLLVPCLFNSGTVIGKRGMTALEIAAGRISLVYWFDATRGSRFLDSLEYIPERLAGTDYYRVALEQDSLDYIFTRTRLLAG